MRSLPVLEIQGRVPVSGGVESSVSEPTGTGGISTCSSTRKAANSSEPRFHFEEIPEPAEDLILVRLVEFLLLVLYGCSDRCCVTVCLNAER